MSDHTTNLHLPLVHAAQAQKHVPINMALLRLDALAQATPLSRTTSAQPGSPADGAVYILPPGKTGADWGAMANYALAHYRDGVWEQITPRAGWVAFVQDEARLRHYSGSAWQLVGAGVPAGGSAGQVLAKASSADQDVVWTNVAAPIGLIAPFAGATAPGGWLLCYGQAVSRTTYAALFTAIGAAYGAGDGSTTFNLPDLRGRAAFGKDNMGGSAANRITSGNCGITGTTLGAAGGDERHHQHTHAATVTDPGHNHANTGYAGGTLSGAADAAGFTIGGSPATSPYRDIATTTGISVTNANAGAGAAQNMPPALVLNYIVCAGA